MRDKVSTTIIAITGPSASGKTLFAQTVYEQVQSQVPGLDLAIIEEDAYYRDQSHLPPDNRTYVNYDHPSSIEHELLLSHLNDLRAGKPVEVPVYDYNEHMRTERTRHIAPAPVIIVEGILLLGDQKLRDQFDIKLFVNTPLDICLMRRIARDMEERGRSLHSITEQYESSVRPMYYQFIEPSSKHADIIITGGGRNSVALDIVKNKVLRLLEQSTDQQPIESDKL